MNFSVGDVLEYTGAIVRSRGTVTIVYPDCLVLRWDDIGEEVYRFDSVLDMNLLTSECVRVSPLQLLAEQAE